MNTPDPEIIRKLEQKVGRPVGHAFEGDRCVELDLTSENCLFSGLIRRHSDTEKQEIMALVGGLTGLKRLNLRRNKLRRLPPNFADLRAMEHLNLGSNYLGGVPEQIRGFRHLKYLHLGNDDITELPEFMGGFSQLEYLTVHKNLKLKSVEALAPLTSLKALNLYFLNLGRLPAFVYNFKKLVTLTLWNIHTFTDELAGLTNVEYFSDCGTPALRELPPALTQLKKLRMVRLFQNNLERLPDNFGDLENLEQVSLYQNQLSSLPESMARLQKLQKLNLGWNLLQTLPPFLSKLRSLDWLAIFENPLQNSDGFHSFASTTKVLRDWPFTTLP